MPTFGKKRITSNKLGNYTGKKSELVARKKSATKHILIRNNRTAKRFNIPIFTPFIHAIVEVTGLSY